MTNRRGFLKMASAAAVSVVATVALPGEMPTLIVDDNFARPDSKILIGGDAGEVMFTGDRNLGLGHKAGVFKHIGRFR